MRAMPPNSQPTSEPQADRVLFRMCLIIAVTQLGFGALVPVLPLYAQSFGVSVSAIGLTIAVYGFARFVFAMRFGRWRKQIGQLQAKCAHDGFNLTTSVTFQQDALVIAFSD